MDTWVPSLTLPPPNPLICSCLLLFHPRISCISAPGKSYGEGEEIC